MEATIASAILLIALLAGFLALESASNATKGAERQAIAASVGEREIESLLTKSWDQLANCPAPSHVEDPLAAQGKVPENPLHYVVDGTPQRLRVLSNYRVAGSSALTGTPAAGEELVVGPCVAGAIDPGPTSFNSGGVTGKVYRFVSWRGDACPPAVPARLKGILSGATGLVDGLLTRINDRLDRLGVNVNAFCSTGKDSKRLTVAVVVDSAGDLGPLKPTWISTIQPNPAGGLIVDTGGRFDFD